MTRYAPEIGEMVPPQKTLARRMAEITVGVATTNDVVVTDCGSYTLLNLLKKAVIHKVYGQVNVAFTASVTLAVGDSDSSGRFAAAGTFAATTSGAVLVGDSTTVPYVYSAAQDMEIAVAGAVPAAGQATIFIDYSI